MIRKCDQNDFSEIFTVINDAATAYKGIIPEDRWHDPYMPEEELKEQITQGVEFWCYVENTGLMGVMGIQDKGEVTLIRHAYVRTSHRNTGIGSKLLNHLVSMTTKPVLIGTWADAKWAIGFYIKHGFQQVSYEEKERLLRKYWDIPERQIETSVVLVSPDWETRNSIT